MIASTETPDEEEISYLFQVGGGRGVSLVRVRHGADSQTTLVGRACDLAHAFKARAWLT
jgi:hypothetical protein